MIQETKNVKIMKWVLTIDLQNILIAPPIKASVMYYKSKLVVHNFAILDLKNKDSYCYLFHENQGGPREHKNYNNILL